MSEPKKKRSPKRYRVVVPKRLNKTAGHPTRAPVFQVKINGKSVDFPDGIVVQASKTVEVGDINRKPPLVNSALAQTYPHVFVEEES